VLGEQRTLVAAAGDDAGRVSHQLAQRHRPRFLGERRHVRLNLVVEFQASFLQQPGCCRGEHLGRAPDPEPAPRREGLARLEIREPESFCPHHAAVDPDRHGNSREILFGERGADDWS
jgi:hypothetical protein